MGIRSRRRFHAYQPATSRMAYLHARKNSLLFLGLFLAGLTFGSFYAVADGDGSMLLISILVNSIQVQSVSSYLRILLGCLWQSVGLVLYLYFCSNCLKGKWLVRIVPLFYGLSVGAVITSVLYQFGFAAMGYVLLCLFLPKFLQLVLIMAACNQALRLCGGMSSGASTSGEIFVLLGGFFVALSLIEAFLLHSFCGLLVIPI